ncbi:RNA polymerase sigma factor [Microbacteriaceae bacterium VKM Ac-2855]|nr:RNA polymerase sigma factor [Microbacteriaceae bacterium VKM Ac-2855]
MTTPLAREAPPGDQALRLGDPTAFAHMYTEFRDRVFWHALRHTNMVQDAEDITALVFLESWRKHASIRIVNGSPLAWLLASTNYVASNLARSRRRHREAMNRLPHQNAHDDFSGEVNDRIDSEVHRAAIRVAFRDLPVRDQDVLSLCVVAEMSDAEAAAALGVPVGTVKSRLSRAKKKLAGLIDALAIDAADDATAAGGAR